MKIPGSILFAINAEGQLAAPFHKLEYFAFNVGAGGNLGVMYFF